MHITLSTTFFLNGLYFIKNQWFPQPQCNSTPCATEEPGNYNIFPQTALQWENQTNKYCQAMTWVKHQAIWIEMEDFGKGEPDWRIMFQSNNQEIIMTLLIEWGRLGKLELSNMTQLFWLLQNSLTNPDTYSTKSRLRCFNLFSFRVNIQPSRLDLHASEGDCRCVYVCMCLVACCGQ